MKTADQINKLKLRDLLRNFCGKPTPFKLIDVLDENDTVENAIDLFEKSSGKRKVIGIKQENGNIVHLGYNELKAIINGMQHQL